MNHRAALASGAVLVGLIGTLALGRHLGPTRPAHDRPIDVDGHRLHARCEGTGRPTVVMDSGLGVGGHTWDAVVSEVAKFTSVCSYDRARPGWSDARRPARTSRQLVGELHALLAKVDAAPPYLLVGHSFGGLNVRLYAGEFPGDVVGVVLVDASHEDQSRRFAALMPPKVRQAFLRTEGGENPEGVDVLASNEEVRRAPRLPPVPLVVLTADHDGRWGGQLDVPLSAAKAELQADLARLVPGAVHITVKDSGHSIQRDRPESVVAAIRQVVAAVRSARGRGRARRCARADSRSDSRGAALPPAVAS